MKFDHLQEQFTRTVPLVAGLVFAVLCGMLAGEGQFKVIGAILGVALVLMLIMSLKSKMWLLIPLCWPLSGIIPALNVPLGIRDFGVLLVFGSFLFLIAFKIIRKKPKFAAIDLLVLLNLVYLGTVFVRNPVGVKALGDTDMVGGKPYFNVAIGFLAYWVLSRVPVNLKTINRLPLLLLVGPTLVGLGTLMTAIRPSTSRALGLLYVDFAGGEQITQSTNIDPIGRKFGLSSVGLSGMQVLCSYFRPLTLLIPTNPGRFIAATGFILAILFSGFRSALMAVMIYFAMSSYFRKQGRDLILFGLLAAALLPVLAVGNGTIFTLPLSVQRALSFLPGNWDPIAVADAKESIDWRVAMWDMVWHEEKWIQNRWLGDGFGFTRRELDIMEAANEGGSGFAGGVQQEAFMITGVYHNGPLSTIRYVGVVGMIFYYLLAGFMAVRAVHLIRINAGNALFPATLFVGMPAISYALTYPLGTGQFDMDAPQMLFTAGLIKLLDHATDAVTNPAPAPSAWSGAARLRVLSPVRDAGRRFQPGVSV